jgi:hypothetical protein
LVARRPASGPVSICIRVLNWIGTVQPVRPQPREQAELSQLNTQSLWAGRIGLSIATVSYLLVSHDALLGGTAMHAFWFVLGVVLITRLVQESRA